MLHECVCVVIFLCTHIYLQTLAKVICSVLKFSAEQTRKVMEKETKKTVCGLSLYIASVARV